MPDEAEIAAARAAVGWQQLEIDCARGLLRKLRPGMFIDLNAIAPGYAVDRIAAALDARGLRDYVVELGGEVRARGTNTGGKPWQIGIETPNPGEQAVERIVPLQDAALSTSGDYRSFIERDGVRYGHSIDPRSGRPVLHSLASVSVIAPLAVDADALATALMVLGPDDGYAFAVREKLPALFIIRARDRFVVKPTPALNQAMETPPASRPRSQ
jgi:thiamine biosynthesis lipoprotein